MKTNKWLGAVAAALVGSAAMAADLGVSVHVSEPGLYGRVDIGRVPTPPALVYQQPIIVHQQPVAVQRAPIYMHVPPGHAKKWDKHCGRYNACGQPVYFVQENWYQQNVVQRRHGRDDHRPGQRGRPDKHEKHEKHEKKHHGQGHGQGHGKHDR